MTPDKAGYYVLRTASDSNSRGIVVKIYEDGGEWWIDLLYEHIRDGGYYLLSEYVLGLEDPKFEFHPFNNIKSEYL